MQINDEKLFCRLCLGGDPKIKIFQDNLYNKIALCCNVQIEENDKFPKQICISCLDSISKAFEFRNKCETNNAILWRKCDPVKIEHCYIKVEYDSCNNENDRESVTNAIDNKLEAKNTKKSNSNLNIDKSNLENDFNSKCKFEKENSKNKHSNLTCETCGKNFSRKDNLIRHLMLMHSRTIDYTCEICGKPFKTRAGLQFHNIRMHPKTITEFACEKCSKVFKSKENLKRHIGTHVIVKNFNCESCGKLYNIKRNLQRHINRWHSANPSLKKSRDKTWSCKICDERFYWRHALSQHVDDAHLVKGPYKCLCCEESFPHIQDLRRHFNSVHSNFNRAENPSDCTVCPYCGLKCDTGYWGHVKTHMDGKSFVCRKCGMEFESQALLDVHLESHVVVIVEKAHRCNICDKSYTLKKLLNRHVNTVHLQKYKARCEICGQECADKTSLKGHVDTHREGREKECEICHKKLANEICLMRHMLIHMETAKKWECRVCHSKFAGRSGLTYHLKLHTGERAFSCPCCECSFIKYYQLISHFKKKHPEINFNEVYQGAASRRQKGTLQQQNAFK